MRERRAGRKQRGKRLAIVLALLCASASVKVAASPGVRRPVAQFIHFYEQTKSLDETQAMSLWDRVLFSVLMTKTTAS